MASPTPGDWRIVGTSQIYAGLKMIGMIAVKDVPDFEERIENLKTMAAGKDMREVLENHLSYLQQNCYEDREHWKEVEEVLNKHFKKQQ